MRKKLYCFMLITLLVTPLISITVTSQKISSKSDLNSIFFNNSPPYPPNITVPDKIITGKWFKIKVSITDPDSDNVYIRFNASILPDLPEYWFGPIPSGTIFSSWVKYKGPTGSFTIGVQAKDTYDAESEWTYVKINIYKNKAINTQFLNFYNRIISNFLF
ncbi:hypothetical protein AYK24_08650 [Thermoplasmatales archaeon SG8-52-4]|nr:MAG: hypothetical protein AYK24_08650 [Thermoplasmatales archaeon SG8-52-4]